MAGASRQSSSDVQPPLAGDGDAWPARRCGHGADAALGQPAAT